MKIKRLVALLAVAAVSLPAEHKGPTYQAAAIVCMNDDPQVMTGVRTLASAMFASIGVKVVWRDRDGSCPSGLGAVQVRLSYNSTGVGHSGALAFAQPYEGTVVVFLDRFQGFDRNRVRSMIAHVLVHEIAHVLEGVDRHSTTGIMKAHWNDHDYAEMRRSPLPFAWEDVNLIHAGLRARDMGSGSVAGQ